LDVLCQPYTQDGRAIPILSASASRDRDESIHLSLCNLHPTQAVTLSCELRGMNVESVTGRVLTAETIDAHNTFEQPKRIRPAAFDGVAHTADGLQVDLPARSVVVLAMR
jgi:alpha-N-arabinofuranosidase